MQDKDAEANFLLALNEAESRRAKAGKSTALPRVLRQIVPVYERWFITEVDRETEPVDIVNATISLCAMMTAICFQRCQKPDVQMPTSEIADLYVERMVGAIKVLNTQRKPKP